MRLNWATLKTLFQVELRMVLRDRRMILTSIVLPLVVMPLMFFGSGWTMKKHRRQLEQMEYLYVVSGDKAELVRELMTATRERLTAAKPDKDKPDKDKPPFRFREVQRPDPRGALETGDIHLVIEGLESAGAVLPGTNAPGAKERTEDIEEEKPVRGAAVVRMVFRADRHESTAGMSRLGDELRETRRQQRAELLQQRGFPVRPAEVAAVTDSDLASTRQVAGLTLGRTLTMLLLVFILSSGAVVAIDSLAGEKERGTLETLLTTAAGRLEILTAKHLVIMAVALVITLIQLGNLLLYLVLKLLPVPANFAAAVTPGSLLLLFVLYVPLAALSANVLLLVSGYARSYKEAQMYFLPVLLVGLIPALAPALPGIPLRSLIVLVPVANIAVAARDILIGDLDWPMIAAAWLMTAAAVVWTGRIGVRVLLQEKLVMAVETDAVEFRGGQALFERRVLRWFALLWAVLLMVSNYTQTLDLRLQISINLVGLFFGACCLIIWRYRLDPRQVFSLRAPRPAVWLGVLLAVPGGFLAALGAFQLANRFIPAPAGITETFTGALFPPSVPFYQILLFLTLMPGIFEELTFRGVLLHGLRGRMHPVLAAVVVGVVFGLFHVALFRLVPTACLGIMFAAVTLLTRSIYPAMLWHCLSNAMGLLAYKFQLPENGLDPVCYLAGFGLLAVAFWIFWRHRSPRAAAPTGHPTVD